MKKIIIFISIILGISNVYATELPVDVLNMDIKSIQASHDLGLFTYDELVSFYKERIDKYSKQYNSFISINEDAIKEAKEVEEIYQKEGRLSDLMGIPIVLKDNIDYVKLPTTVGTKVLKDNYPKTNSTVVDKLLKEHAIIIGKSNMSEFAFSANNSKSSYGHTKNAYNTLYSPYGSSGGSASIVASGLALLALGTDTNASIRTPSSANNVVGLRPTCSSVSSKGVVNYDSARDVVGPIARYVDDLEILYNVIKEDEIKENKDTIKIGVLNSFMKTNETYDGILELMNKALSVLDKKYELVYIDDFYNSYYDNIVTSSYTGRLMCYDFNQYIKNTNSKIRSFNELVNKGGYIQPIQGYAKSIYCDSDYKKTNSFKKTTEKKEEYRKYVDNTFTKYDVDVLIYPTTKNKLLKISETGQIPLKTNSNKIAPTICYPSMNVSIGFYDSLPYGMEILSKTNNLDMIFQVAKYYEEQTNHYVIPKIAKNIYEIPESVKTLVKYYQEYNTRRYKKVKKEAKNFFKQYNEIENKEEEASLIVKEYEKKQKKYIDKNIFHNILFYVVILIIILFMFRDKKSKKRKVRK